MPAIPRIIANTSFSAIEERTEVMTGKSQPNKSQPNESQPISVRRLFFDDQSAILAHANIRVLIETYLEHAKTWALPLDGLGEIMMRQALGAAALHLSCRPHDEEVAWTFNFTDPAVNLFVTGGGGRLAGRYFVRDVQTTENSRLFVETRRAVGQRFDSAIEVDGLDILRIFEQYYTQSVQTPVRFFEITDEEFAMVMGLPMTDRSWIDDQTRESTIETLNRDLKPLDTKDFRWECGCSRAKVLDVVQASFAQEPEALFEEEAAVEVDCPRCGRRWVVTRRDFQEDAD